MKNLLSAEVQTFLREHEHDDERQLVLKQKNIFGVGSATIAHQIAGRRKAKEKLPTYYRTSGIIYPPGIHLEQTSSEQTASFKSLIVSEVSERKTAVDLTGGFGIDSFFLSKLFSNFHYVEPNAELLDIARHNHMQLAAANIQYHNATAEIFLSKLDHPVDLIYIDPSRRSENKKVFTLSDSEPNIAVLQNAIFEKTNYLLVKAAPLLDIKSGLKELSFVKNVFVLSVDNEVKELLFFCDKEFSDEPLIKAVNVSKQGKAESFEFFYSEEIELTTTFSDPLMYLYEPNASILKAGAFKITAARLGLQKIQVSTHLYTSTSLIENFPGRIFKVEARVKPDPKHLIEFFPDGKANVTTRNYPLSVEELKKKTRLKDGGEKFLIGFSGVKEKFLIVASRVK